MDSPRSGHRARQSGILTRNSPILTQLSVQVFASQFEDEEFSLWLLVNR